MTSGDYVFLSVGGIWWNVKGESKREATVFVSKELWFLDDIRDDCSTLSDSLNVKDVSSVHVAI